MINQLVLPDAKIDFPKDALRGGVEKFPFETPADIINEALKYIFPFAGLILFFFFIAAGFMLLTSAGNEEKTKKASSMLTSAVIGFVILFVSFWLMKLLQFIFGFEVL